MPIYEKLMGNPFVDAGVCGICEWLEVQPEDITKADLEEIMEAYIPLAENWEKWNSIFTLNHKLVSPSIPKNRRVPEFTDILSNYLDKLKELDESGNCMGCGRRDVDVNLLDRTGVPLTGGQNSNFFSGFSEGAGYCAACSFAIQFLPLSLVATGAKASKFLMLHSKSWELMQVWTQICISGVNRQYSQQGTGGCFKPEYLYSRNGLFYMVREMILEFEDMQIDTDEELSMQVYSFTNNNQYPGLETFYIPSHVFRFLCAAEQNPYTAAWREIVSSGYIGHKPGKDHKKLKNLVYEYLLEDRSIRGFFFNRKTQKQRGNWELLSLYLQEVRNMNPARIETLRKVGDLIAESIRKSGNKGKGRLNEFANARTYFECRSILLRIFEDRIEQKEPEPLFSFDECVEHIFISGNETLSWSDELDDGELDYEQKEQLLNSVNDNVTFWRETRDMLLFRIYEKLYNWLTEQEEK